MKPLDRLIARERTQHERNLKEFEVDALIHQSRIEALEKDIKQAAKNEKGAAQKKAASLDKLKSDLLSAKDRTDERPTPRRYRTNDTTVEKAGELLRENPFGLLIMRDELAGLLGLGTREAAKVIVRFTWKRGTAIHLSIRTASDGGRSASRICASRSSAASSQTNLQCIWSRRRIPLPMTGCSNASSFSFTRTLFLGDMWTSFPTEKPSSKFLGCLKS